MPVKIRLSRRGRKKLALYDIVVTDSRSPRDGKFIEKIGTFNPNKNPVLVELNDDKALKWIMTGAQPTDTARQLLSVRGIMFKKHLQVGVNKGAVTQEQADTRFAEWLEQRQNANTQKVTDLTDKSQAARKERLAAEAKVNTARQEALQAKNNAALAAIAEAEALANPPAPKDEPEYVPNSMDSEDNSAEPQTSENEPAKEEGAPEPELDVAPESADQKTEE